MLQDGVIVIGQWEPMRTAGILWNWSFDSELLNLLAIGVLSTILSYQLTATFYNAFLGCKTGGIATACDIHKLLLIESSSPLEIFSAVARLDVIDRIRFRRNFPKNAKIARRDINVKKRVAFSLLILLLIAPSCNLIATFIGLGRERTFNVGHALSIGNSHISYRRFMDNCELVPIRFVHGARPIGVFHHFLCFDSKAERLRTDPSEQIRLSTASTFQGVITFSVISLPSNIAVSSGLFMDVVSSEQGMFRVQPVFSQYGAARVIYDGQNKLADFCAQARIRDSESLHESEDFVARLKDFAQPVKFEGSKSNNVLKASKDFNCSLRNDSEYANILFSMREHITIIEHDNINVANVKDLGSADSSALQFFDARELKPMFVQPGRLVNILPFLAITLLFAIIRILTDWAFNNDVEEGVEAILRYRLGIGPTESLMRSPGTVTYNVTAVNSKWQEPLGPLRSTKAVLPRGEAI